MNGVGYFPTSLLLLTSIFLYGGQIETFQGITVLFSVFRALYFIYLLLCLLPFSQFAVANSINRKINLRLATKIPIRNQTRFTLFYLHTFFPEEQ